VNKTLGLVLTSEESASKMFGIHADDCPDLAKRVIIGNGANLSEMGFRIAKIYGGYSDNGDAPTCEAHALSWATIKACARKIEAVR